MEAITNSASPTYSGILPAADCAGIRYTLTFDYPDGNNAATAGTYTLDETYLDADPADANAYKDGGHSRARAISLSKPLLTPQPERNISSSWRSLPTPPQPPRRSISSSTRLRA